MIVGAGEGPCVGLAMSSRENQQFGPYGEYTENEVAARYGASPPKNTQDGMIAYLDTEKSRSSGYKSGWLPGE